jgi:hypothetical protein
MDGFPSYSTNCHRRHDTSSDKPVPKLVQSHGVLVFERIGIYNFAVLSSSKVVQMISWCCRVVGCCCHGGVVIDWAPCILRVTLLYKNPIVLVEVLAGPGHWDLYYFLFL